MAGAGQPGEEALDNSQSYEEAEFEPVEESRGESSEKLDSVEKNESSEKVEEAPPASNVVEETRPTDTVEEAPPDSKYAEETFEEDAPPTETVEESQPPAEQPPVEQAPPTETALEEAALQASTESELRVEEPPPVPAAQEDTALLIKKHPVDEMKEELEQEAREALAKAMRPSEAPEEEKKTEELELEAREVLAESMREERVEEEKKPEAPPKESPQPQPSQQIPEKPAPKDSLDAAVEDSKRLPSPGQSKSMVNLRVGDHKDLKERTAFHSQTFDGVLKRTTFMHSVSTYPSSPHISIASKTEVTMPSSNQGPAPGSYNLPDEEKSKFKATAKYSFGAGTRFGLGASPTKQMPGPGQYNPKDPSLYVDTKVGFGTSVRGKGNSAAQANPGPGAYENKSTVGGGLMFTARGRHPTSYMRSRSLPGPGAYTPAHGAAYQTSPKCGFGTSVRGDFVGGAARGQPGPGTYEMQNFKCMGKDSKKFSATSRRRMHDLNSYVTPGPGTYNAHMTSFGHPGATSCEFVDRKYRERDALKSV